ncbi:alpha-1,2-fucosyltransferase [Dyadobacter sp. NIV53]|uniref:alpha-1,2-fucosyltransferase n=1 Tax=Dyadobacter sp. NIV53 TaxID=2861765 RepID=UPI001C869D6A|nr:alpha-1,2-fucosyltransferase [Dyadobacter sp. NIV53]
MIISKISHGLGNQLFQYAIARSMALKQNTSLYLDLRYYNHTYATDTFRSFKLNKFNINFDLLDESPALIYLSKSTKLFPNRSFPPFFKLVRDKQSTFEPEVLSAKSMFTYLSGFWQTEKYFRDIKETLQKELTLKSVETEQFKVYKKQIQAENCPVSLHIRRGDYVNNTQFNNQFGFIGLDYYRNAIKFFKEKSPDCKFFVFSDDLEWVKENLNSGQDFIFVENTGENSDLEDLMLMRACHHHIIANSSFSWWGAWLNPKEDKIVIAPARWYNNLPDLNTNDLVPENWIRL